MGINYFGGEEEEIVWSLRMRDQGDLAELSVGGADCFRPKYTNRT